MTKKAFSTSGISLVVALLSSGALPAHAQPETRLPQTPILSRDAKQVVYVDSIQKTGGDYAIKNELWIVNAAGTDKRQLTSGPSDAYPRFSPDGKRIVFAREHDLWIINSDGSGLSNITNTKSDIESGAEFTNDGLSLIFPRSSKEDPAGKAPPSPFGGHNFQSVVLRNLASGIERVLLGNGYGVSQVVPVDWDDNVVFVLCRPVDNDGKPGGELFFKSEVAVLKLDGSLPRMVFQLKADSKYRLQSMRIRQARHVFEVDLPDKNGLQVGYIQDGELIVLPDAPTLGDVSSGGNTIIGTAVFDGTFRPGIVFYNIQTKETWPLFAPPLALPTTETAPPMEQDAPPIKAQKLLETGVEHYYEDEYQKAIGDYTKAIGLYPQFAEAYYHRAEAHQGLDDEILALADLTTAIHLNPKFSNAYRERGKIHDINDHQEAAIKDYTAAIGADPKNYLAMQWRGEVYVKQAQLDLALADFSEVIRLNADSLTSYMERGEILMKQGKNAAALENYSTAIDKFPTFARAYEMRAKAYRALGKTELAVADEKKAKTLNEKN